MNKEDENREKEIFVYLDFGGKFTREMLQQPVFLRIANLHKENPLVQLNENVYKGTYDYALGTNLFFEMSETEVNSEYFDKRYSVSLNHCLNGTKVIQLQLIKVRPKIVEIPNAPHKIEYNFKWDYNTLLNKFENGTLDLKDFIKEKVPIEAEVESKWETEDILMSNPETEPKIMDEVNSKNNLQSLEEMEVSNQNQSGNIEDEGASSPKNENVTALEFNYQKLKQLARKPTKREIVNEIVTECDKSIKEAYEYHNIEKQILQPCDAFFAEKVTEINEDTLADCVDINRCVLYGLIDPKKDYPRLLTAEEKHVVLTLDNFDNLSLAARYYVLCEQVKNLEKIESAQGELFTKDEYGRTVNQTIKIYKQLKDAVAKRVCEIKCSLDKEE